MVPKYLLDRSSKFLICIPAKICLQGMRILRQGREDVALGKIWVCLQTARFEQNDVMTDLSKTVE